LATPSRVRVSELGLDKELSERLAIARASSVKVTTDGSEVQVCTIQSKLADLEYCGLVSRDCNQALRLGLQEQQPKALVTAQPHPVDDCALLDIAF
jgi:hypothetical protein